MEKFKDILYDIGDILFGLVIVIAMVGVVTIKLSSAMDINILDTDINAALLSKPIPENEQPTQPSDTNAIVIDNNDKPENTPEPVNTPSVDTPQETPVVTSPEVVEVVKDVALEIPKGSTAASIAELLESKKLVDSSSSFLKRVQELKLDPKLKYGTYNLKSNYTLDQIISKLTGVDI